MKISKLTIMLAGGFSLAALSPVLAANGSGPSNTSGGTMSAPVSGNAAMKTGNTSGMNDGSSGTGSTGASNSSDANGATGANAATTKGVSDGMRPGKSSGSPE